MELRTLVGDVATVFTVGVFLSGIQICRKIFQKKSTNDISALPFMFGFLNCSLWIRYGVFIKDSVLLTVNSIGLVLQLLYLMCYGAFLINKMNFVKQLFGTVSILVIIFFYTSVWLSDEQTAQKISGLSACSASVIFIASPLASMAHVIRTKSSECLPFYMSFFSFIMASLWVWYGVLVGDPFIQVPNFLGAIASGAQLALFLIYPAKKPYHELSNTA